MQSVEGSSRGVLDELSKLQVTPLFYLVGRHFFFGRPPAWHGNHLTTALCTLQASLDLLQTESLKTNAEQVQTWAHHLLSNRSMAPLVLQGDQLLSRECLCSSISNLRTSISGWKR